MKFEKITNEKIQIILSTFDLELNDISINNISSNSINYQKLLQSLIEIAEQKLDFNTGNSDLVVETLFCSNKSCILTITKLVEKNLNLKNKFQTFIFEFNNFEDFISLCYFLKNLKNIRLKLFSNNFSLILYNNKYYLKALDLNSLSDSFSFLIPILSEFGKQITSSSISNYSLDDYGKKIFEKNAILQCLNKF